MMVKHYSFLWLLKFFFQQKFFRIISAEIISKASQLFLVISVKSSIFNVNFLKNNLGQR